ncbi:ATP-grasp domain-containing protein [Nocardia sp. NPDC052254]|uniref:ATP-grasp domain-containing protein n=1 Tax=Nocardia sp. NPDC052254 TaxID=3155681 RepID=UPI003423865C
MRLYLLSLNPTDSVYEGFLPAARRLGLDVVILTDCPGPHLARWPESTVVRSRVRDPEAVLATLEDLPPAQAIFSNSDHLQACAARVAAQLGLPGKDFRVAQRVKDKAAMRRQLRHAGLDEVWAHELAADEDPSTLAALELPTECVIKPREGVASEDVFLVDSPSDAMLRCKEIRQRRPGAALVLEEYLDGPLYTMETLGDGSNRTVLGGFATTLSPPPHFVELQHTFVAAHPDPFRTQVLEQLDALGIGFGCCHTEFVVSDGRARLIEVNYRAIGDQCDLVLDRVLDTAVFEQILRIHLGESLPTGYRPSPVATARVDHVCAPHSGELVAAPISTDTMVGDVELSYRALRDIGVRQDISHTNRDHIGVLRTVGPDSAEVDRAADRFLAAQTWAVTR